MTQAPEYIDLALIPTISPTPSVTPTPNPTFNPIIGWVQTNSILVAVLLLMLIFFFMMKGISFSRDFLGDYINRIITLGRQAKSSMAQSFFRTAPS